MQDQVAKCLKEFSNEDRDFRYMALVDLEKIIVQSETETNAKLVLDKHEEVGAELIKLLKDPLAEIQTEAINCRVAGAKEAQKIVERVLHELENKDKQMKYMHLLFMVIQEAKGIDNEEVLEAILKILQDEEQIEGWESAMLIIEQILVDGVKMNNMDLIGRVVEICRGKIKYDPNYIDDDMDEDEEYIEEDDEYAEEYVDEEDDGWRYRKAAAKVIKEVGKVYQKEYAREALCILKSRLNDREEVVKREILGGVSSIFLSIGETHGVQLPKEDVYEILTRIESERNKKGKSEELIKAELNCYLATIEVVKNSVGDFGKEVDAKILEKVVGENKEYFGNEIEVFKIIQGVYSACGKMDSINNEMAAVTLKELSEKMENGERSVIIEAIQTATVVLNKCEVQRNKEVIGELILDKAEKMRASGRNDPELAKKYMEMMLGLVENEKATGNCIGSGICVRKDEFVGC
ncbi:Cullin-associated NEDD8-dissociated protein 1 [Zancudomyces culisetae]|uniref:Cullin-associated NEDD8-dissociated protein 1 n=1 Tax=Zancudomyces culisetae TaxID=1213189 RepID=A0A1R1PDG7_ZANCU|nr:Cullin-associated NEDD8-dissociated protein 1 [Zancudomyces culisetae]|eukprot:OMH78973.1 Cullin-associated NEDD8-dissociated protein 1 [Zancudomyces culisetae]